MYLVTLQHSTKQSRIKQDLSSPLSGGSAVGGFDPPGNTDIELSLSVTSLLLCITTSLARVIGRLAGFNLRSVLRPPPRFSSSPQPDASVTPPARLHPSCRGGSLPPPPPVAAQTWREGRGEGRLPLSARLHC